uniref:Uncharacterized protein n=1 Tax=Caenorhabditis japonica TaxID=281687 RepID=A0A8R1E3P5_CAEJA
MEDHRFTDTILRTTNVQSAIQRFEKRQPAPPPPFREELDKPIKQNLEPPRNPYESPLFVNTNVVYPVEESSTYFPQITPPREHVTYGATQDSNLEIENLTLNRFETGFKPSNFGKTIQGIYNSSEQQQQQNQTDLFSPGSISVNSNVMSPDESLQTSAERKDVNESTTIIDNSVSQNNNKK